MPAFLVGCRASRTYRHLQESWCPWHHFQTLQFLGSWKIFHPHSSSTLQNKPSCNMNAHQNIAFSSCCKFMVFWQYYTEKWILAVYMHPPSTTPQHQMCLHSLIQQASCECKSNSFNHAASSQAIILPVSSFTFLHFYVLSLCIPTIIYTSWADVVKQSVVPVSTKQGAWKHNSVERNVVFGHKLVELHFLRVLPPLLPLISVAGSDRQIATDCRYRNVLHACMHKNFFSYQQHCRT